MDQREDHRTYNVTMSVISILNQRELKPNNFNELQLVPLEPNNLISHRVDYDSVTKQTAFPPPRKPENPSRRNYVTHLFLYR